MSSSETPLSSGHVSESNVAVAESRSDENDQNLHQIDENVSTLVSSMEAEGKGGSKVETNEGKTPAAAMSESRDKNGVGSTPKTTGFNPDVDNKSKENGNDCDKGSGIQQKSPNEGAKNSGNLPASLPAKADTSDLGTKQTDKNQAVAGADNGNSTHNASALPHIQISPPVTGDKNETIVQKTIEKSNASFTFDLNSDTNKGEGNPDVAGAKPSSIDPHGKDASKQLSDPGHIGQRDDGVFTVHVGEAEEDQKEEGARKDKNSVDKNLELVVCKQRPPSSKAREIQKQEEENGSGQQEDNNENLEEKDGSGNEKQEHESGNEKLKQESGNEKQEHESGNEKQEHQSGNEKLKQESRNEKQEHESGNEKLKQESGNEKQEHESRNEKQELESGNEKLKQESGNEKQEHESGNEKLKQESGNEKQEHESGNEKQELESGNEKLKQESGNEKQEHESRNEKLEHKSGNERQENETGKGNQDKTEDAKEEYKTENKGKNGDNAGIGKEESKMENGKRAKVKENREQNGTELEATKKGNEVLATEHGAEKSMSIVGTPAPRMHSRAENHIGHGKDQKKLSPRRANERLKFQTCLSGIDEVTDTHSEASNGAGATKRHGEQQRNSGDNGGGLTKPSRNGIVLADKSIGKNGNLPKVNLLDSSFATPISTQVNRESKPNGFTNGWSSKEKQESPRISSSRSSKISSFDSSKSSPRPPSSTLERPYSRQELRRALPRKSFFSSHDKAMKDAGFQVEDDASKKKAERLKARLEKIANEYNPLPSKLMIQTAVESQDNQRENIQVVVTDTSGKNEAGEREGTNGDGTEIDSVVEANTNTSDNLTSAEAYDSKDSDSQTTGSLRPGLRQGKRKPAESGKKSEYVECKPLSHYLEYVRDNKQEYLQHELTATGPPRHKAVSRLIKMGQAFQLRHHGGVPRQQHDEDILVRAAKALRPRTADVSRMGRQASARSVLRSGDNAHRQARPPSEDKRQEKNQPIAPATTAATKEEDQPKTEMEKRKGKAEDWTRSVSTNTLTKARIQCLRELGADDAELTKWWDAFRNCHYLRHKSLGQN